jgi:hypothetical protein
MVSYMVHSLSEALHRYRRRPSPVAQAILNRAVSRDWTKILFGPNSGQIFSNVVSAAPQAQWRCREP